MRFTVWLALAATLALWSGNWIVARAVRDDIAPGFATVGRLSIVLAILLPFTSKSILEKLPALTARDWTILAALGLTGGGPHLAMQWLGLHYTTATNGILYLSTVPIFILLFAPFTGERIRRAQWAGVAISFCGVAMIAAHGDLAQLMSLSLNVGDLLALGSMVMWSSYTLLLRVRRDPLQVVELLTVVCAFGLCFIVPWVGLEIFLGKPFSLNRDGALAILYSAVGSLLVAYAAWSYVVTRLGAARAGVTLHLMPAIGVVMAAAFLNEYPRWYHFAGIALILAGVGLSSWQRKAA
jgi:drug/metabolite transporter (DMT)-like permease